jgi:hypothetical protein
VAEILQETLEEEKAADETLSTLAQQGINPEAATGADDEDEDEDEEEEERKPSRRSARGGTSPSARSTSRR